MLERSANLRPHRAERIITAGRLLVAIFLVIALLLDPTDPVRYVSILRSVAFGYLGYAALLAAITWTRHTTPHRLPIVTHVVDLALFSVLMHLSEAPTSPFFIYFIFATVCGALRWYGRGALLTGIAALAAYVAISYVSQRFLLPPEDFDGARFITRCTQLAAITLLLTYLGDYQHRLQAEIARLAAWPRRLPTGQQDAVRELLTHAAAVLRTPRVVLAWQEEEEPSLHVATLHADRFELRRERPDAYATIVADPLGSSSFLCENASADSPYVVHRVPGGFASWRGKPLSGAFCERFSVGSVLGLRVATDDLDGHLFALDRASLSTDDLLLGDVVGRLVTSALEQQALMVQLRDSAIVDERLRLARELHDGVLQSLTAVALQAGRARTVIGRDEAEAERRLAILEDTLLAEQRALREMLEDLQPGRGEGSMRVDFDGRLRELAARLARQWEVAVTVRSGSDIPLLPSRLAHEVGRMVEEAIVNAIRHGGAREVRVQLESAGEGSLCLQVAYDGRGFSSFTGRHDLESLTRLQIGPRTLKERAAHLRAGVVIESHDAGARLEIVVPTTDDDALRQLR